MGGVPTRCCWTWHCRSWWDRWIREATTANQQKCPTAGHGREDSQGSRERDPLETATLAGWVSQLGKERRWKELWFLCLGTLSRFLSHLFHPSFQDISPAISCLLEGLTNTNRHTSPTQALQPGTSLVNPRVRDEKLAGE